MSSWSLACRQGCSWTNGVGAVYASACTVHTRERRQVMYAKAAGGCSSGPDSVVAQDDGERSAEARRSSISWQQDRQAGLVEQGWDPGDRL